jgi:hypothetical protein
MSICITVGIDDDDAERAEYLRDELRRVNELLAREGLAPHREPDGGAAASCDGVANAPLENMRCIYAYCAAELVHRRQALGSCLVEAQLAAGIVPRAMLAAHGAYSEPLVDRVSSPSHHMLWHPWCEGFFVPIDFPNVLEDEEIVGGRLGSSQRLLAELVRIAGPIGIALEGGVLSDHEARRIRATGVTKSLMREGFSEIAPECVPLHTWLTLYEAASCSVERGSVIVLT